MKITSILLFSVLLIPLVCFGFDVPDGDPLGTLLQIIQNWKASGPLFIASSIIVLVVQAIKKFYPEFKYLRVVVVLGGVIHSVIDLLIQGRSVVDSIVTVLLVSGGALAIYELFKDPINLVTRVKK